MQPDWDELAERDKAYEAAHFKNAAYHLMTSQILYESTHGHGTSYRLISRYPDAYRAAFELFGVSLVFDRNFHYIAAIPMAERQTHMRKNEALLLLVLRKAYHEHFLRGNVDQGIAVITIDELQQIYKDAIGRELPVEIGELREVLAPMRSCGAIRLHESDGSSVQPFDISILPGIASLVSVDTISRLAEFKASGSSPEPETDDTDVKEEVA